MCILILNYFNRKLRGRLGTAVVSSNDDIDGENWHHVTLRYDAQSNVFILWNS